jgi:hypothetical protein
MGNKRVACGAMSRAAEITRKIRRTIMAGGGIKQALLLGMTMVAMPADKAVDAVAKRTSRKTQNAPLETLAMPKVHRRLPVVVIDMVLLLVRQLRRSMNQMSAIDCFRKWASVILL